ncbi:glycosyltransferase involved in cell wall biosynthesis [Geomicrobium halophilum]|uniref:Glycosyltransferase involved in cell wall biosynthesis n=1 Tax=Geomicrobium halophilum TaxID=549000 RepID=A0A841PS55_9BACL|nr:glycosyltransferase [Geomicrobium halophilum]MBB6450006.1 glycosyltransferase involved in cell wall biosynthesis [Geomicrobium halophilum]
MRKTVCMLVSEHPFLDARIFHKEAKSLRKHGYEVTMIVPRRNGQLFDIDGTPFTYRFQAPSFTYDGIKVISYDPPINVENNVKLLAYNLQQKGAERFTDPLTQLGVNQECDFYHAHEFFSLYAAIGVKRKLAKKGKQTKIIYDSHELVPDPLEPIGRSVFQRQQRMLEQMFRESDAIITVSESIQSKYKVMASKVPVEVIYNSPPLLHPFTAKTYKHPWLTLGYVGTVTRDKGNWKKLLKILELCNEAFDTRLKIIGGTTTTTEALSIPERLKSKVEITGWMDYSSLPKALQEVDIGWIDLNVKTSLNRRYAMPNKFFSYLNNGIPVIVNQCDDMKRFIDAHQCGTVIDKEQASARDYAESLRMIDQQRQTLRSWSMAGRKVMEDYYSWEHMEQRIYKIYRRLWKKG